MYKNFWKPTILWVLTCQLFLSGALGWSLHILVPHDHGHASHEHVSGHQHGSEHSQEAGDSHLQSCGHSHSGLVETRRPAKSAEDGIQHRTESAFAHDHDCILCQYLTQFTVTFDADVFDFARQPESIRAADYTLSIQRSVWRPNSRGPPVGLAS